MGTSSKILSFVIATVGILSAGIVFQNCAKASFTDNAVGEQVAPILTGDEQQDRRDGFEDPSTPEDPQDPTLVTDYDDDDYQEYKKFGQRCENDHPGHSSELVECGLRRTNAKILIYHQMFELAPDASADRVCMTKYACLKLIDAFAAKRGCNIEDHNYPTPTPSPTATPTPSPTATPTPTPSPTATPPDNPDDPGFLKMKSSSRYHDTSTCKDRSHNHGYGHGDHHERDKEHDHHDKDKDRDHHDHYRYCKKQSRCTKAFRKRLPGTCRSDNTLTDAQVIQILKSMSH